MLFSFHATSELAMNDVWIPATEPIETATVVTVKTQTNDHVLNIMRCLIHFHAQSIITTPALSQFKHACLTRVSVVP